MLRSAFRLCFPAVLLLAGSAAAEPTPRAMTLEQALASLESENPTLAQARSRAREVQAVVRQATAPLLPAVAASGSYTRNSDDARLSLSSIFTGIETALGRMTQAPVQLDRSGLPADTIIQPLEAFSAAASVRVPLFASNAYADREAARHGAELAESSVEVARLQLQAALVQTAWLSNATEGLVLAAERAVATSNERARSAARALEAGTGSSLASLRAQTEVVRRESELARANAERERARLAVGTLLGKAQPVIIALPPPTVPGLDAQGLVSQALEARPELAADRAAIDVARAQVRSAWWRLTPQLSASFSAFASDVPYPTGDRAGWKATADLSWVLFDGGFRYGKRQQAEASVAGADAAAQARRLEIEREVRDAAREVGVAGERLRLAEQQKRLADEAQRSAKRGFEAGVVSSLEQLDADERAFQADVALTDAQARLGLAIAALDRATGRGF